MELVSARPRDDRTIAARPEHTFAIEDMKLDRRRDAETAAAGSGRGWE
jgi:hypothetical protein